LYSEKGISENSPAHHPFASLSSLQLFMRSNNLIIFLFLLLPVALSATVSQHPYYIPINRSTGLPSEEVYDIFQDNRGFIWLATGSGLYRHDGYSYTEWQSDTQTSAAGSCIQQDKLGRIWYENFDGYLYYTSGNKLRTLQQNTPFCFMPFGITDKYLFVLQAKGIDIFDIHSLSLVKSIYINIGKAEHATCHNDEFYIVINSILYKIDASLSISEYKFPNDNTEFIHQLFFINDSLYVLPRLSSAHEILVLNNNLSPIQKIAVTAPGNKRGIIKIGNDMWLYSSTGCEIINANKNATVRSLFSGKSISKILQDRNGNYWFATTNEGIFIIPNLNNIAYNVGSEKIKQVASSNNGILIATQSGRLMHMVNGQINTISEDKNNAEIYYLYADDHNIIYSSTGYTLIPRKGKSYAGIKDLAIKCIVPIDEKYYAVATSGMCLLLPKHSSEKHLTSVWDTAPQYANFTKHYDNIILYSNVRARSVAYDSTTHTIFYATNLGILAISPTRTYHITQNNKPIYAAFLASFGGYIYAADTKGKLLKFTSSGTITTPPNLPNTDNIILLKYTGGHLYFCTQKQLYECMPNGDIKNIISYIDADEINDISATDTCLWLATKNGLMSLSQDREIPTAQIPGFYINAVMVNDNEATTDKLLQLGFKENNIAINYSLLEFAASVPVSLSYSINGSPWKELPRGSRLLQFRSLSPGSYNIRFLINNTISDEQVNFSITAPFWLQAWFYVLCFFIIFIVAQLYNSQRMKVRMKKVEDQKNKLQLEEQLSRSMLSALRSQMNPHFFFNALNTVQAYIFTNEKSKASDYLAKLSMLTRTILDMSEAETVLLTNEIDALNLYLDLEKTRFGNDFNFEIKTIDIPDTSAYEIPSMIIQPFVENAVKHGLLHKEGEKKLNIRFVRTNNQLIITIDDNGIGRAKSEALNEIKNKKYKSYSTRATGERVKLLNVIANNKITVDITDKLTPEKMPAGTLVTIKIEL